jgi:DNA-binding MarR family transcriptional regulator
MFNLFFRLALKRHHINLLQEKLNDRGCLTPRTPIELCRLGTNYTKTRVLKAFMNYWRNTQMHEAQERLSTLAMTAFGLNGLFLAAAEQLATPAGLTAARWQVLGAILTKPLTQSEIARRMGITRQSVRRTSMQLVEERMSRFIPNPANRKAMLLEPTKNGHAAVNKINPQHAALARQLEERLGKNKMAKILDAMVELRHTLETIVLPEQDE